MLRTNNKRKSRLEPGRNIQRWHHAALTSSDLNKDGRPGYTSSQSTKENLKKNLCWWCHLEISWVPAHACPNQSEAGLRCQSCHETLEQSNVFKSQKPSLDTMTWAFSSDHVYDITEGEEFTSADQQGAVKTSLHHFFFSHCPTHNNPDVQKHLVATHLVPDELILK